MLVKSAEEPCFSMTIQGTVLCLNGNNYGGVTEDRGRFSVLTKGIRYAILKQGDVICQEEHESNQKPAFIM